MSADATAVRERLVQVFKRANPSDLVKLAERVGATWQDVGILTDAVLAAVSRPAEARGEPDYLALADRNGHILTTRRASEGAENILAQFPADEFPNHAPFTLVPLYAHPTPSGGEGEANLAARLSEPDDDWDDVKQRLGLAAPRPEPGEPSEAMVETLAKRLAEQAWVDEAHRSLRVVSRPFDWELHSTPFQKSQWIGAARLHLRAILAARGTP